jgi:type II secretory pathway component PulK
MRSTKGSILIFSLWILTLLTIFAVHIGMRVRQRIDLSKRIEDRQALYHASFGCIKKATAAIRHDLKFPDSQKSYSKSYKYNNPDLFHQIKIGPAFGDVSYEEKDPSQKNLIQRYGFIDEERKLNINYVDRITLKRLLQVTTDLTEDKAAYLAESIIDWRQPLESKLEGFNSDSYYLNLKHPYTAKKNFYENLEELKFIEGMTDQLFVELKRYLTVYGNGQVNVNTASFEVLIALGWNESVVQKFLKVRNGADSIGSTVDDYFFTRSYDIASEMKRFIELDDNEVKQIDTLNALGRIKTESAVYTIGVKVQMPNGSTQKAMSVYDSKSLAILFYRENF